jgi:outer membrane murein-binding lipoprotein Lpp
VDAERELAARVGQLKVTAKSLRNHARTVAAQAADLEDWLNATYPQAQEAQGTNGYHHTEAEAQKRVRV